MNKITTVRVCAGFTVTMYQWPYPVTLYPNPENVFQPTQGIALGVEKNNVFGGERLIVKYKTPPIRKSTGEETRWSDDIVFVSERDVNGWDKGKVN